METESLGGFLIRGMRSDTDHLLESEMKVSIHKTIRASDIAGTPVRSPGMEDLGEIEDIVINLETGKIAYAALRYEGWFQRKLIAIPWSEFKETQDGNDRCFFLNATRKTLRSASGFSRDAWPDKAFRDWDERS